MNISFLHHLKSLKPLNIRGDPWPVMANTFPAAASYVIQKTSGVLQLLKHHLICSDKYILTSHETLGLIVGNKIPLVPLLL